MQLDTKGQLHTGEEEVEQVKLPNRVRPWLFGRFQMPSSRWKSAKSRDDGAFDRSKQLRRLFLRSLLRLFVTMVLALLTNVIILVYSSPKAISNSQRQQFNALIIGISIGIGINVMSSLKSNIGQLRWWLLSRREASPREADLILQSEDLGKLLLLGCVTRRFSVRTFVLLWLCFTLISQIAIALLGLTYNANDSTEFMITEPGPVTISNLAELTSGGSFEDLSDAQAETAMRNTAYRFGSMVTVSRLKYYSNSTRLVDILPPPGTKIDDRTYPIFCEYETTICRYVFPEESVYNSTYWAMVATRRHVAASTNCESWKVTSGGDGFQRFITVADGRNTTHGPIPALNGPSQSIYMFNPNDPAASGRNWAIITVLEASSTKPWFYICNSTLDTAVVNAAIKEHQVGRDVPRLATQAIALQGYGSSVGMANSTGGLQFQSYPVNTLYGNKGRGDASWMGSTISQFTIGAIGGLAIKSPSIDVRGMTPIKSATIEVPSWQNVYIILGFTVGFQAFLSLVSIIISNRVQVFTRSHLAMATLLQPVVQDLDVATIAGGAKQTVKLLGSNARLTYMADAFGVYRIEKTEN